MYGDADELDRLVGRLRGLCGRVRGAGPELRSRIGAMQWESLSAGRFRRAADDKARALGICADKLDEALRCLAKHAEATRQRSLRIQAIEQSVTQWFGDQLRTLDRMADGVTDAVSQAAKDPPWSVWQWKPHSLPAAPGDKAWLEVGEFLRRQGVF